MRGTIPLQAYHSTHRDIRQSLYVGTNREAHGCVILAAHLGRFALPSATSSEMVGRGVPAEPSFPKMTQPCREAGMILVTVLLFMAVILALVIHSQVIARTALRFEERQFQRAQLRAAAAEAAWEALRALASDDNLQVDHTNEAWAALQTNCLPNTIETIVMIADENRFFNVNNLAAVPSNAVERKPVMIVGDMFAGGGWPDPAGETQTLKDWVDRDTTGTREAGYYRQAQLAPTPPDAPLESPAELAGVLNAGRTEFRAPPPELTVLPDRPEGITPVNINTAGREVLLAVLGAGQTVLADKICRRRDAYPIKDLNQVIDAKTLEVYRSYLAMRSSFFSLIALAVRGGRQEAVYALVRRDDRGEIEILRWVNR